MNDNDEDAFLNAIHDNPEDDTARLVYADWLDEHDESAKAEYLRLMVAIVTTGEDIDTYDLWVPFWELLYALDREWRRRADCPRMVELIDSLGLVDDEKEAERPQTPTEPTAVIDHHHRGFAEMMFRFSDMLARLPVGQPLVIDRPPEEFQKTPFGLRIIPKLNRKARRAKRKK